MSFLKQIAQLKADEVKKRKAQLSLKEIKAQVKDYVARLSPGFAQSLRDAQRLAVIAEVKGASPSQGVIQTQFDPLEVAIGYADAGATAISVLTDETYFNGHHNFLRDIAARVDVPCLQKDFFIDDYQVYESKLLGSSAILLIVRMLSERQFQDLHGLANELDLDVLVEVHDEAELELAQKHDCVHVLGINNRNLDDLTVDIERCLQLKDQVASSALLVAESGLETIDDLRCMDKAGFDAVLMGTALMKTGSPAQRLKELLDGL